MYFLTALGLFFYQSLDAIDGMQARRTKSSSPLGELFDHGCDSLSAGDFTLLVESFHRYLNIYCSISDGWMLLCCSTCCSSLAYVLVLYVIAYSFL